MGFLIAWVAVVAGVGALLAGWLLGPSAGTPLPVAISPEMAALVLVLVVLLADAAATVHRRRRR